MKKTSTKKQLNITVDRDTVNKILAVGYEFDINKDGLFDARSGCVNFWCSPEDKPDCWNQEITQAGLDYPRDYVGGLYWDYKDDKFDLYLDVSPYQLMDKRNLSDAEWESCVNWTEKQAKNLLRLARMHETNLGTCCPFCDFVLPTNYLLDTLIDHIVEHDGVKISGITLGRPIVISTNKGSFQLKAKTDVG